jgi:hypothetical protein
MAPTESMDVFISFSGKRSRMIAEAIKEVVEAVIPHVHTWVASQNMPVGSPWMERLTSELSRAGFGILCLTKGNLEAPWVAYEAGALMRSFGKSRVCPYLNDVEISHLSQLPLPYAAFQAVQSDREGTYRLVRSIWEQVPQDRREEKELLDKKFTKFWPELKKTLDQVRKVTEPPTEMDELRREMSLQSSKVDALHDVIQRLSIEVFRERSEDRRPARAKGKKNGERS